MDPQRTTQQPGMTTRLTTSIPSKRSQPTALQVLAGTPMTRDSKASPGSAGANMTSCNASSARHNPLQAVASLKDRPTNWAHYYQLILGFHHLQAEPG